MLKLSLSECKDCSNLSHLVCQIDDKIAYYTKNMFNNMTLMICADYNEDVLSRLLHYKRILTNRTYNCDYAAHGACTCDCTEVTYSTADIISRVKILINK